MPYPEKLSLYTIWDEIISFIDLPEDLLSLALTCHAFKELIIPDHLEYRQICCDPYRKDVWEFLDSRPRLARNIRLIKLLREPSDDVRLPRVLTEHYDDAHLSRVHTSKGLIRRLYKPKNIAGLITKAILRMVFLKDFIWAEQFKWFNDDISNVLTSLIPRLEGLSVDINWRGCWFSRETGSDIPKQVQDLSLQPLTGLKRVVLKHPHQTIVQMTISCTNIEDLCFRDLSCDSALHIMEHGNWKNLRRLSLSCTADDDPWGPVTQPPGHFSHIITSFFHRHANIECLYLCLLDPPMFNLPSSCLPKLRSLGLNINNKLPLMSLLSADSISRLVHLDCPFEVIDVDALPGMRKLRSFRVAATSSSSSLGPLATFLQKAPFLKKICLAIPLFPWFFSQDGAQAFFRTLRYGCTDLTHFFCDIVITKTDDRLLLQLCEELSSVKALQYIRVNLYVNTHDRWDLKRMIAKLERDEHGIYTGYQFVMLRKEVEDSQYWGDIFHSLFST